MKETIDTIIQWKDPKQMLNKKFNSLQVLSFVGSKTDIMPCGQKSTKYIYHCKCDCGNIVDIDGRNIVKGRAKSCGHCGCCKTHSSCKTRLYRIWCDIKARCYNSNTPQYQRYGARGITMCNEWKDNFVAFKDWAVKNGYKENLTIDRINNDFGYSPDNCRWVDTFVQSRNRTDNNKYQGVCLTDWAKILKVKRQTLSKYVKINGWEKAIEHFNRQIPQTIEDIIFWHSCFFKNATLNGQLVKYEEELGEYIYAIGNEDELLELADMVIVCCGIMRFDFRIGFDCLCDTIFRLGVSKWESDALWDAVETKMEKNRARTWAKTTEGTYHHVENEE